MPVQLFSYLLGFFFNLVLDGRTTRRFNRLVIFISRPLFYRKSNPIPRFMLESLIHFWQNREIIILLLYVFLFT